MLKITGQRDAEPDSMSVILEGRLAGPWVEELATCWREMPPSIRGRVVVDLTGVTFIDTNGKALLVDLWRQGADLRATGCLNRCIVDEITKLGSGDCSNRNREEPK